MLLTTPVSSPSSSVVKDSCNIEAFDAIASWVVNTGVSTSYSTSMRLRADSATWGLEAATPALAWPAYRTLSLASILSFNHLLPAWGKSFEVTTALTPSSFSALLVSIEIILAWACGLLRIFP